MILLRPKKNTRRKFHTDDAECVILTSVCLSADSLPEPTVDQNDA
ncbi:MAG: hypothetical protein ACI8PP_002894, partial [Candidatus Pseudothioglobus sp.]